MKFIHAADIHLDSPLVGLERYDGAPIAELRGASRRALENLVKLAISEQVSFVLLAGDLYDGDWRDYHTGLFFIKQMAGLHAHGIPVFLVSGNHDAASQISKHLVLPDNVHRFPTSHADTILLEEERVAIHGQGYATPRTVEHLASAFPAARSGYFNIGLLHTSLTGRPGHAPYAPCTEQELAAKGYDYWALGHVHTREVVSNSPWIVFPGNIQGRHIRESGAKGCTVVTVHDNAVVALNHHDLDVARWQHIIFDASEYDNPEDIVSQLMDEIDRQVVFHDQLVHALRLSITGSCGAHRQLIAQSDHWMNEIRAACIGRFNTRIWVEKILMATDLPMVTDGERLSFESFASMLELFEDEALLAEIMNEESQELHTLLRKLPIELESVFHIPDLTDPADIQEMFSAARQLLLPRLLGEED